jgi:hypothetical protein
MVVIDRCRYPRYRCCDDDAALRVILHLCAREATLVCVHRRSMRDDEANAVHTRRHRHRSTIKYNVLNHKICRKFERRFTCFSVFDLRRRGDAISSYFFLKKKNNKKYSKHGKHLTKNIQVWNDDEVKQNHHPISNNNNNNNFRSIS